MRMLLIISFTLWILEENIKKIICYKYSNYTKVVEIQEGFYSNVLNIDVRILFRLYLVQKLNVIK